MLGNSLIQELIIKYLPYECIECLKGEGSDESTSKYDVCA